MVFLSIGSAPRAANENNTTSNPLSLINPNDIESIVFLKEPTAIYGSRGANGVVIMDTTKKVELQVEFSAASVFSKISKIVETSCYEYALCERSYDQQRCTTTLRMCLPAL